MSGTTEIRVAGKTHHVPSAEVSGRVVVVTGSWLRTAALKHEELVDLDVAQEGPQLVEGIKKAAPRADIFSFAQKLPDVVPRHSYYFEPESWAVIRLTSYEDWWNALPQEARKNVRRAAKRGVVVKSVPFDDELVKGIQAIYNETPVRQGRPFWHYGKDFPTVKNEMGTYLDRSDFIGAYLNGELSGFIKVTYVGQVATIMQILARNTDHEARPMNALLATTVELCHKRGAQFLLYGQYVYGRHTNSALTEFKRRNGFEEVKLPRYFIPLTAKGTLAIKLGIHAGLRDRLPPPVINLMLKLRSKIYHSRVRTAR